MSQVPVGLTAPQRTVHVLLFEGFELLDVFGPVELFDATLRMGCVFVGESIGPVASSQGVEVVAQETLEATESVDILLVPGGAGTRSQVHDSHTLRWLQSAASTASVVSSVCTGSALLAAAGLLERRRATSNKVAWEWVTKHGRDVDWQRSARWVHDGPLWTSSGVSSGMDMACALIVDLLGEDVAAEAARAAEYQPRRNSEDDPFAHVATG